MLPHRCRSTEWRRVRSAWWMVKRVVGPQATNKGCLTTMNERDVCIHCWCQDPWSLQPDVCSIASADLPNGNVHAVQSIHSPTKTRVWCVMWPSHSRRVERGLTHLPI